MFNKMFMACGAVLALSSGIFAWTAGPITVDIVNSPMDIKVSAGGSTLLEVTGISLGSNYTAIAGVTSTTDSIVLNLGTNANITISAATNGIHFYGKNASANSVALTLKNENEHFFGITEQNQHGNGIDLAGITMQLTGQAITSGMLEPNAKAYAAVFMSSNGYLSFFNSFSDGTYAFGKNAATTITHQTNTIDWYIFYGPTGDIMYPAFYKTIGILENLPAGRSPVKKVPIWGCGLVPWHDNDNNSGAVVSTINSYTSNKIPITACWIDRPYSNGGQGWGNMDWSSAFANPTTWIPQITSPTGNNTKLMTWICPCTFGNPAPPTGDFFNGGYDYLDLTNPVAVQWYQTQLQTNLEKVGIQGHKLDRTEETFSDPMAATWADGTPNAEKQEKYMYLNAKVTDQSLRAIWGDDQFLFPRGSYHRAQPYISSLWGGDTRGWQSGGFEGCVYNGVKSAFCGFSNWGSDVGGYVVEKTQAAIYLKWLIFGCFCGFMENKIDSREPWTYTDVLNGKNFVAIYKEIAELRMSLVPYTYSIINSATDQGVTMRPLPYMYPSDPNTYTINDEWLFGPSILVAPLATTTTRSVYLPAGTWYNFFDPSITTAGGKSITVSNIPADQIPAYIKGNSLYLTGSIYDGNSRNWITGFDAQKNLVINAFPGAAGEQVTFAYIDYLDKDTKKNIVLTSSGNDAVHVTCPVITIKDTVKVHLSAAPSKGVTLNGVTLSASQYTWDAATLSLCVPSAPGAAIDLFVGMPTSASSSTIPALLGSLHFRVNKNGCFLVVPAAMGLSNASRITASILTISGKQVWKGSIDARSIVNSEYKMLISGIGSGSYISRIQIDGKIAAQRKILVP